MLDARHQFGLHGRVGPQFVGHHHPWGGTLILEQLAHQSQGRLLVSPALQEGIEDVAIGIDGAPEPIFLTLDGDHHFIKLPLIGKVAPRAPAELVGEFEAELRSPFRDGLERDLDAALGKKILDITKAERKPEIEPDRMGDDLSRETVAFEVSRRDFGHCNQIPTRSRQSR